ncbi:lytic transglycosylase domain-containing protein [Alphaproteobacteria bacterium]|nr:lytic transglycosylase domain-containing protein [Alphaproteobacteria bacterium]
MQTIFHYLYQKSLTSYLVAMAAFLILFSISAEAKSWTPEQIKQIIIEESLKSETVPPSLALAIAHVESNFKYNAVSHKGAIGVMQIMPATAWGEFRIKRHQLFNPRINIRIGIQFMEQLLNRYRGRVDLALSHYNGGSAVGKWPNSRVIPYTQAYVNKVMLRAQDLKLEDHTTFRNVTQLSQSSQASRKETNYPSGSYVATRAPQGLKNAPKKWQKQIELVDDWLDQVAPSAHNSNPYQTFRDKKTSLENNLTWHREKFRDQASGKM